MEKQLKAAKAVSAYLILMLLFAACEKENLNSDKPKEDYFHCYINGQYWEAYVQHQTLFSDGPIMAEYQDGALSIRFLRSMEDSQGSQFLFLVLDSLYGTGEYHVRVLSDHQSGFHGAGFSSCEKYYHDSLNPGMVFITEYKYHGQIAGKLSMTLRNPNCEDSLLVISAGSFLITPNWVGE